ncbi:30S ribosomal protein S18 [Kitasatospora sp. NPDC097691]|uniref:30S ribosomal protein S18 n=1 Tax=Kitasatospora sp. NPDC097691 TaxID=3157231 RepID=UPI003319D8AC
MRNRTAPPRNRPDHLIAAGIEYVDDKDTDLLRRFVSDRGRIRSRRVTLPQPSAGGTPTTVQQQQQQQQRAVARAIKNARETALLPYTSGPTR